MAPAKIPHPKAAEVKETAPVVPPSTTVGRQLRPREGGKAMAQVDNSGYNNTTSSRANTAAIASTTPSEVGAREEPTATKRTTRATNTAASGTTVPSKSGDEAQQPRWHTCRKRGRPADDIDEEESSEKTVT